MKESVSGNRDRASAASGTPPDPELAGRLGPSLSTLLADFARLEELPGLHGAEPLPEFEVWNEPDDEPR